MAHLGDAPTYSRKRRWSEVEEIEAYAGSNEIPGIRFRPARQALGVSSWGINVLELDPGCAGYPEHDHASDGHEEVSVVLRGSIVLQAAHTERLLSPRR